ncbi:MAG: glycosyltransferase family 2 protein [Planctomycetota bacterium]
MSLPRTPPRERAEVAPVEISIVVPVFDEEHSLPELQRQIATHLGRLGRPWEVVYVDDRSRDASYQVLLQLRADDPHVRIVRFRRNFGQTAAMAAGFEHSRGGVVVTMDADLQNDPADIPRLVEELESGYDMVVGWRKRRQDGFWIRRLPSRIANALIARVTGSDVHDTGCTLKAFRRELVENLPIYAEQHRFLPVLALGSGARIAELVVNHRPRQFGKSKYGLSRAVRVLVDLLTIKMISSFSSRPLQYFALLAAPCALATVLFLGQVFWKRGGVSFGNDWGQAALLTFMLLTLVCVYFLLLGLLAELVVKVSGIHGHRSLRPLQTPPR